MATSSRTARLSCSSSSACTFSLPVAVGEELHEKNETGRSPQCSDLQTGWALHKPRNEAVRFPTEVKQYLTSKLDLGERTGIKSDPAKVATDMRTARNPDSSWMFERKHWLTKGQVQGFFLYNYTALIS